MLLHKRLIKIVAVGFFMSLSMTPVFAQQNNQYQQNNKGKFYVYWGWNRGAFSNSDIRFKGENYDFTLSDVSANDRPTPFGLNPYFRIDRITIPQTNYRIGYFFKENYTVSIGVDHMKYVMSENQVVNINGDINTGSPYDGSYSNDDIALVNDFLEFEHTDGLNYINIAIRRFDEIHNKGMFAINLTEGIGIGGMMPRTDTTLLGKERYDEFHWSGYGLDLMVGLNFTFWEVFFIQPEFKVGWINMPGIRTAISELDGANQSFSFTQFNVVFGGNLFHLGKK